jgi:hypothetical protein
MKNEKSDTLFVVYSGILFCSVFGLIAILTFTGNVMEIPEPLFIVEHLLIGLGFRAAYKSLDGNGFFRGYLRLLE